MIQQHSLNKLAKYNINNLLTIVLVEPSKPQNLGSIARIILNFGFSNLILVNPLLDLSDPEIQIVARRANTIINHAEIVYGLKDVRDRFDLMIGTTARVGNDYNLRRVAITPEQLVAYNNFFENVAIVFGREQHGLSNEEIELCNFIVNIPTHPSYSSMNLSHAAAIILYFLSQKLKITDSETINDKQKHRAATYNEKKQLMSYFTRVIKTLDYHPEKQHIATQAFENILSRGYVTGRELSTLMGVFKWVDINLQKESKKK